MAVHDVEMKGIGMLAQRAHLLAGDGEVHAHQRDRKLWGFHIGSFLMMAVFVGTNTGKLLRLRRFSLRWFLRYDFD